MSSITATRVSRTATTARPLAEQAAEPSRKPARRRPVDREGSAPLGRAGRPVLRIVADDERAPVVTRIAPPAEPVETPRRIALDDFFAAEYDGDDQRVTVTKPRPSSVRLTRRGRIVVLGAGLAAALGLGVLAATQSLADSRPEPTRVVTVQPGQTLWDVAAATGTGDVRSMMSHLESVNHLDSTSLQVGQHLRVPIR